MGYYSDVAIECGVDAYEMIKETAETCNLNPTETFKNIKTNTMIINWKQTNWCDEREEIRAINDVLEKLYDLDTFDKTNSSDYAYKIIVLTDEPDECLKIDHSPNGSDFKTIRVGILRSSNN